jgi:hypothetical protein
LIINRTPTFKQSKDEIIDPEAKKEKTHFQTNFKKKISHLLYSKNASDIFENKKRNSFYKKRSSHASKKSKNFSNLINKKNIN